MSLASYPPLIEGKLPAFSVNKNSTSTVINIPYTLNKAVSKNDFTDMIIRIKTVTTGTVKLETSTAQCHLESLNTKQKWATFIIEKDKNNENTKPNLETFTPIAGNYYKVQLAFQKSEKNASGTIIRILEKSPWSSVGVIKCTSAPNVTISGLKTEGNNLNPSLYVGIYENSDVTEKLYSYNFIIQDDANNIYETSGTLIHNGSTDENISQVGVRSTFQWRPKKSLNKNKIYRARLEITTINDYHTVVGPYYVKASSTVDANIPAELLATPDYDNGRVHLSLIKKESLREEEPFSGNFMISRYTKSDNSWNEVCRFNMLSQVPSEVGTLWTDCTIEHGEQYLYALQAYNTNDLYSNRQYHVLQNPHNPSKYLDFDEFGEPYYVIGDFEDMFLTDGDRQLKIKFDPKVSTYKPTILESKIETIGSKYPFIFRNGSVNYKEFAISGLLSHLIDDSELFMQGIKSPEDTMHRSHTSAATGSESRKDWVYSSNAGSKLTSDNFFRERQFKTEVLNWLTNGKPKLFRSPGEGNFIVQLMNTSLTPNDTLGRMLHSFSSSVYEVADHNFENLSKYHLLPSPNIENRTMKYNQIKLTDSGYTPGYDMYHVYITDATPGTVYTFYFNSMGAGEIENQSMSYEIGNTGTFHLDTTIYPVSSIQLGPNSTAGQALLNYGYYDTTIPDHFSYISNITSAEEAVTIEGYDWNCNIIEDKIEDIRRQADNFYSIKIYIKDIRNMQLPCRFKFNDTYTLDLSTGNAYLSVTGQQHQAAQDKFIPYTLGYYQVVGNFGDIRSMHLDPGVCVELSYELKEIEYSIEALTKEEQRLKDDWMSATDEDEKQVAWDAFYAELTDLKQLKENWLKAKQKWRDDLSPENYNAMQNAYCDYIEKLQIELTLAHQEGDNYAL